MDESEPLEGLRVVELAWVWSGPMVCQYLANFGAEVIKVEHNDRLDMNRLRGRPVIDDEDPGGPTIEVSPPFLYSNAGKKSVTLNMKSERGSDLVKDIVAESDVVVENYTPGTLASFGLEYDELKMANPEIILLSMSPAGQYGSLSNMRSYAPIMSSLAGIESLVGYDDESEPIGMLNVGIADPNAASQALFALLAALYHRERTGTGQQIDFSQYEAQIAVLGGPIVEAQVGETTPSHAGNNRSDWCPHGAYPTDDDGWLAIAVGSEAEWQALVDVVDREWIRADQYVDLNRRKKHESKLDERLAEWTSERGRDQLATDLRAMGVPVTPVRHPQEFHDEPSFAERDVFTTVDHEYLGEMDVPNVPWRFSTLEHGPKGPSPELGAHNDEIFGDLLEMDTEEVERLKAEKVIY